MAIKAGLGADGAASPAGTRELHGLQPSLAADARLSLTRESLQKARARGSACPPAPQGLAKGESSAGRAAPAGRAGAHGRGFGVRVAASLPFPHQHASPSSPRCSWAPLLLAGG